MRHPLDGTQTPEREDLEERAAIAEYWGNQTRDEAEAVARRCAERARAGYPLEQAALPWKVPA